MTSFASGQTVSMPRPAMRRQKTPNNSNASLLRFSLSDSISNDSLVKKERLNSSMKDTENVLKLYDPTFDGQNDVTNFVNGLFNDDQQTEANLPHLRSFTSLGSSLELKEPFETSSQNDEIVYDEELKGGYMLNEEKRSGRYSPDTQFKRSLSNRSITSVDIAMEDIAQLLSNSGSNYVNIMEDEMEEQIEQRDQEEKEGMKQHSATLLKPTQTGNLSFKAFGQNVGLSRPIFDAGNGIMVVGTQNPVKLLSSPKEEIDGHKVIVSRLINDTGSCKTEDFGILKQRKSFSMGKHKYSLHVSKVLPVVDRVHDLTWVNHSKVALATGSTLTLMQLDTWLKPANAPISKVTTKDLLNILKVEDLHTDDIRAVKAQKIDDLYATIATGGFDGKLNITKIDSEGTAIRQIKVDCKKEVIGSIEFHKDWREVVSFTEDCGVLKLFDMRNNKVVMKYESMQCGMYTHAYDIDGNVVCGFEANKGGHHSMEFVDLRRVNSVKYKPILLYGKRDPHMKAIGNICIAPYKSMTRIVSFGIPGMSVWEGVVQPDWAELKQKYYHSPPAKRKKQPNDPQFDGNFIPYSDGNALGVTDHLGNFHIYNLSE
eukprot:g2161.t1